MAFRSLLAEAKSLARAIYKFQRNTGNKKIPYINPTLSELIDRVSVTKPINPHLLDIPKKKTKVAISASSRYYDSFWLTDADKFPRAVACFNKIIANSQIMDSSLQNFITGAVTSAVATAVATIQAKHEAEMLSLREMIEKSLFWRESPSAIPLPNPDVSPKVHPTANSLPKNITERWNQTDLAYFDPHLDKAHGEGEIVLVEKDIYYRNIVLFM